MDVFLSAVAKVCADGVYTLKHGRVLVKEVYVTLQLQKQTTELCPLKRSLLTREDSLEIGEAFYRNKFTI